MLYRIKQFIWASHSMIKSVEYDYVRTFLNEKEFYLFNKLNNSEKHHCIRVCKDSIKIAKEQNYKVDLQSLGKVALLHDIGKGEYNLNIFKKSILVIAHKVSKGKLKKISHIKAIDVYYNHGTKACNLLTEDNKNKGNYSQEILEAIEKHHSRQSSDNILLNILREADNKN